MKNTVQVPNNIALAAQLQEHGIKSVVCRGWEYSGVTLESGVSIKMDPTSQGSTWGDTRSYRKFVVTVSTRAGFGRAFIRRAYTWKSAPFDTNHEPSDTARFEETFFQKLLGMIAVVENEHAARKESERASDAVQRKRERRAKERKAALSGIKGVTYCAVSDTIEIPIRKVPTDKLRELGKAIAAALAASGEEKT